MFLLIDATDRSKISSDQKRFFIALSLYPFHFSRTLPLKNKKSPSQGSLEVRRRSDAYVTTKVNTSFIKL